MEDTTVVHPLRLTERAQSSLYRGSSPQCESHTGPRYTQTCPRNILPCSSLSSAPVERTPIKGRLLLWVPSPAPFSGVSTTTRTSFSGLTFHLLRVCPCPCREAISPSYFRWQWQKCLTVRIWCVFPHDFQPSERHHMRERYSHRVRDTFGDH